MSRAREEVARGRFDVAVGFFAAAIDELDACGRGEAIGAARLHNEMGVACKFAGRFDEAELHYARALQLVDRRARPACDDRANLLHNLGGLAHSRHRYAEGIPPARQGLELRMRLHGPDDVSVGSDRSALAALLEGVGDHAEAEMHYRRAIEIFDAAGDRHAAGMARSGLGSLCQELARFDEAETLYRSALTELEDSVGSDHPDLGHVLNNLGTLHRRRGDDPTARALLARAHEHFVRTLGADHPVTIEVEGNRRRVESSPSPYV